MESNKVPNYIFLITLFISFCISASDYQVSLNTQKDKKEFIHRLSIIDKHSQNTVKEIDLANSYKTKALFLRRGDSPYVFFYTESKSSGLVQIINLDELAISHEIIIDKMTQVRVIKKVATMHNFMAITKDGKHLLAQVGKRKNQKLINIDGESGKIIKQIYLSKKKTLVKNDINIEYVWTRLAKRTSGNVLTIYQANTLSKVQEVKIEGRVQSISHYHNFIFINEEFLNPNYNKFTIKIFDIDKNKLFDNYASSVLPIEFIFKEKIVYLVGRSFKSPKHLKIIKFEDGTFADISNTTIDAIPEKLKGYDDKDAQTLVVFGKGSVVKFDLLDPEKSKIVNIPFEIEGGIVSNDKQRVYVTADSGARIGLVDFNGSKFIGSSHTGNNAKKFGQALLSIAVMAATAQSGYMYIPGIRLSNNTLMLSKNQKFLFAINTKTDDVTVVNSDNLSNKRIYPTGKGTFQILQAGHQPDLPIVVISRKKVSYFDTNTGDLLHAMKYDYFIKVTDDLNLIYQNDETQGKMSLYDVESLANHAKYR